MAGGKGERLWPLSTPERPKHLIPLFNGKSLMDLALERIPSGVERIILTNRLLSDKMKGKGVRVVVEPEPKNTAPALIYATALVQREVGEPVLIAALPSDHYIEPVEAFRKHLQRAYILAEKHRRIITFGIKPTHPHTGYGYIERGEEVEEGVYTVKKFHEKPDRQTAQMYLKDGRFYWNSGMFVWRSDVLLKEAERLSPDIFTPLFSGGRMRTAEEFFRDVPSISIDFAVMEKTDRLLVMEAGFRWSDVGSYSSLREILPKDPYGNAYTETVPFAVGSRDNLVISSDKRVFLVGVEGIAVVVEGDNILVVDLREDQRVREVVRRFGPQV